MTGTYFIRAYHNYVFQEMDSPQLNSVLRCVCNPEILKISLLYEKTLLATEMFP